MSHPIILCCFEIREWVNGFVRFLLDGHSKSRVELNVGRFFSISLSLSLSLFGLRLFVWETSQDYYAGLHDLDCSKTYRSSLSSLRARFGFSFLVIRPPNAAAAPRRPSQSLPPTIKGVKVN